MPRRPPRPLRRVAARSLNAAWRWISDVGSVSHDDAVGRRFRSMGPGSCIAFPPGAVHGESCISIGSEVLVAPFVTLAVGMPGEPLDRHVGPVISLGDRCVVGRGSSIVARTRVEIGDDVTAGPYIYITDHNHGYADVTVPIARQWPVDDTVRIGAGCWLGAGAVVLPGADIGRNVTVAAGSVVVKGRIADFSVVAGAPARVVRRHVAGAGWDPPLRDGCADAPEGWSAT